MSRGLHLNQKTKQRSSWQRMIIFLVAFKKSYKTAALGVVNFLIFSCPEIGVNKMIVDEFLEKG